jgi:hypothetical protein
MLRIYKGRIAMGVCGFDGRTDSHAEVFILDVKRFTASSISAVVFRRTFRLVFCRINF